MWARRPVTAHVPSPTPGWGPPMNALVSLSPAVPLLSPGRSVGAGCKGPTWAGWGRTDLPPCAGLTLASLHVNTWTALFLAVRLVPMVLVRPMRGSGCGRSLSPPLCFMFHVSLLARHGTRPHGIGVGLVLQGASEEVGLAAPQPPAHAWGQAVLATWGHRRTIDRYVAMSHRHPGWQGGHGHGGAAPCP